MTGPVPPTTVAAVQARAEVGSPDLPAEQLNRAPQGSARGVETADDTAVNLPACGHHLLRCGRWSTLTAAGRSL